MCTRSVIVSQMGNQLIRQKDLAFRTGMAESTISYKLKEPGRLSLSEFKAIVRVTHMTDEQIVAAVRSDR